MIQKFHMFEARASREHLVSTLDKSDVDVSGFDREKYSYVDDVLLTVEWNEYIEYSSSRINGIEPILRKVTAAVTYVLVRDEKGEDTETVEYNFPVENIKTACSQSLPFYPTAAELVINKNNCGISFGFDPHTNRPKSFNF